MHKCHCVTAGKPHQSNADYKRSIHDKGTKRNVTINIYIYIHKMLLKEKLTFRPLIVNICTLLYIYTYVIRK